MALSADSERMLMHAACADSYHDFSHPPAPFKNTFNPVRDETKGKPGLFDVCKGLPMNKNTQSIPLSRISGNQYNPDILHKENQMLQELFKGNGPIGEGPFEKRYTIPNPIEEDKKFVKRLCAAIAGSVIDPSKNEEHKATCSFDTIIGKQQYTMKLMSDSTGEVNINEIQSLQENKKKGREARPSRIKIKDLVRFFGTNEVNLVFDACSMNVTSLFKNALPDEKNEQLNVNWLINREFLNDPATKPMNHDPKIVTAAPSQMKFRFLIEADPNPITYTRYEGKTEVDILQRDKFFSLLDFKLGPLHFKSADSNPNTRLEVFQDGNNSIYVSDEPNIQNQIGQCCSYIWAAITGSSNQHIVTASHYQRKRSGDWLQALSCLDTGRLYYDRDSMDKSPFSLKNKNIVLVTHDRILLWYALMQGLDVLFAGGKGLEEAEGGEETDEDEEAESAESPGSSSSGPKLYLVYFSNNKRTQSKDQIDKSNIDAAIALLPKVAQLKVDIADFNTNLAEIEVERNKNIELKFDQIVSSKKTNLILEIFKEFVRYSALDYNAVDINNLERVTANFSAIKDSTNAAKKEEKLSAALLFISTFTSLRLRMDTLADKDAIKTSDNFSRDSAIFRESTMPQMYELFDKGPARSPSAQQRALEEQKTVTRLSILMSSTLSVSMMRKLRNYIDGTVWNEATQVYDPKPADFKSINDMLVEQGKDVSKTNLHIITSAIFSKLNDVALAKPAEGILKLAIESIVKNSVDIDTVGETGASAGIVDTPLVFNREVFDRKVAAAGGEDKLREREKDPGEKAKQEAEIKNMAKKQEYERKMAVATSAKLALDNALAEMGSDLARMDTDLLRKLQKKGARRKPADETVLTGLTELRDKIEAAKDVITEKDVEYTTALAEAEAIKPFMFLAPPPPPRRSIRQRITNFFNIGPTLRSWSNMALHYFRPTRLEDVGYARGGARGDKEFWAMLLFTSYINEMQNALAGFDDRRNLDYKYFQGLSYLVMGAMKNNLNSHNVINMVHYLYYDLPNGGWGDQDEFSRAVAFAGRHIALKAVNKTTGELPNFRGSLTAYSEDKMVVAYENNVRFFSKFKDFDDRKKWIMTRMRTLFSQCVDNYYPSQPIDIEVPAPVTQVKERNFSGYNVDFFRQIRDSSPADMQKFFNSAKLTPAEAKSFANAYKAVQPALNLRNRMRMSQPVNRRQTVKAGIMGGKKTKRTVTVKGRKTLKSMGSSSQKKPKGSRRK